MPMYSSSLAICVLLIVAPEQRIEGDASLLELLWTVQNTNATLFPRGKLSARIRDESRAIVVNATGAKGETVRLRVQDVTAMVFWEGERTYWSYQASDTVNRRDALRTARMIRTRDFLYYYEPDVNLAIVREAPGDIRVYQDALKLRPDQVWFRFEKGREWDWFFRADTGGDYLKKLRVSQPDSRHIVVERLFEDEASLRIECDLEAGGNVVGYETFRGRGSELGFSKRRGSFQWAKGRNGSWYLRNYEYRQWKGDSTEEPIGIYRLDVTDFDPDAVIPEDRFEFSSLGIKLGTIVEEQDLSGITTKRYRFGQQPETVCEAGLRNLADTLRQKGFASPSRK